MKKFKNGPGPLSPLVYFINNKRRTMSMVVALAVSILLIMIFQIVFHAVNEVGRLALLGRLENMTVVYPGEKGLIGEDILMSIGKNPDTDRSVPMLVNSTDYYHFFGNMNIPVYKIGEGNLSYTMDKLKLKLKEGRLPEPGKAEIVLDERTARNKGKALGDYIGREVDSGERMEGKFEIVGILQGECLIGLRAGYDSEFNEGKGLLLFAKEGRLEDLNNMLKSLPKEKAQVQTKEYGEEILNDSTEMTNNVTSIIVIVVLFITSFAAANLNYAQYFSRRYEFGTLQSIGFTRAQILLRAGLEILIMNVIGFFFGIVFVFAVAGLLKVIVFDPKGYPFMFMQLDGFVKAMVVPACTTIVSLIPAWWTLSKIDPMEVVELYE